MPKGNPKVMISIRLDRRLIEAIDSLRSKLGLNRSAMISKLIDLGLVNIPVEQQHQHQQHQQQQQSQPKRGKKSNNKPDEGAVMAIWLNDATGQVGKDENGNEGDGSPDSDSESSNNGRNGTRKQKQQSRQAKPSPRQVIDSHPDGKRVIDLVEASGKKGYLAEWTAAEVVEKLGSRRVPESIGSFDELVSWLAS